MKKTEKKDKFTLGQQRIISDIKGIIEIMGANWEEIINFEKEARTPMLENIKDFYVRGQIIYDYVFIDEMLNVIILHHFTNGQTKKNGELREYILEKMYISQKLDLIKNFIKLPRNFENCIRALNSIRNGMAHSFSPKNRKRDKPLWKGEDIYKYHVFERYADEIKATCEFLVSKAFDIKIPMGGFDFRKI